MLPTFLNLRRPASTRFCLSERPIFRLVTSRPTVICVMCSLATFVIGLAIGVLLPANTTSFMNQTGPRLENPDSHTSNSEHTSPKKFILYGKINASPDASDDWASSAHQLDPAESRLDNEEGSSHHLPTVKQHVPPYLRHPSSNMGSTPGSRSQVRAGFRFINPQGKVQGLHQLVADGIFWNARLESLLPPGFSDQDVHEWRNFTNRSTLLKLDQGCGRMQNRKLTFANGSEACCRYRHNNDQIQGEIFSFYLSRILGIRNVPPSSLMVIKNHAKQWAPVRSQLTTAQWSEEKPVVITKFIDDVRPAFIPVMFRSSHRKLHPTEDDLVGKFTLNEIKEIVQWTDLIIFDYLTANLDRVVNNMFNEQWNPGMMNSPTHNLVKVATSENPGQRSNDGLLLFIDNESGLLHGYRLLDKYDRYHKSLLQSICVFREPTVRAIKKLSREKNVGKLIREAFGAMAPDVAEIWLDNLPARNIKILNKRIRTVHDHIEKCRQKYNFNS